MLWVCKPNKTGGEGNRFQKLLCVSVQEILLFSTKIIIIIVSSSLLFCCSSPRFGGERKIRSGNKWLPLDRFLHHLNFGRQFCPGRIAVSSQQQTRASCPHAVLSPAPVMWLIVNILIRGAQSRLYCLYQIFSHWILLTEAQLFHACNSVLPTVFPARMVE